MLSLVAQVPPKSIQIKTTFSGTISPKTLLVYSKKEKSLKIIFSEEAFSNEKLEKTLKLITLVPKQKYTIPQTSNQEIGWFSNQLVRKRKTLYFFKVRFKK